MEDADHNRTRFVVLAREPLADVAAIPGPLMTTFMFEVKNIPAALYKALGGFATNGVNMTKLESYQTGDSFAATRSEEHTSELQSLMRISYAVFCLKKQNTNLTHVAN